MRNLFRSRTARRADAPPPTVQAARPTAERSALAADLLVRVHTRTDPGCTRTLNEDTVHHAEPPPGGRALGTLVVLADGMGGHAAGEVASRMAVETIEQHYFDPADPRDDAGARLGDAFRAANRAIHALGEGDEQRRGMGTTATALAVLPGGRAVHAQVGDSHLYLLRGGALYLLSEDHSLVMELVRRGSMTRAEAADSEDRNVILRALGTRGDVDVSTWPRPLMLQPGDRLLLCSDGLYEVVDEARIEAALAPTLAAPEDGGAAADRLVALARAGGGPDNISVALLLVDAAGRSAPRPTRDAAPPAPPAAADAPQTARP